METCLELSNLPTSHMKLLAGFLLFSSERAQSKWQRLLLNSNYVSYSSFAFQRLFISDADRGHVSILLNISFRSGNQCLSNLLSNLLKTGSRMGINLRTENKSWGRLFFSIP